MIRHVSTRLACHFTLILLHCVFASAICAEPSGISLGEGHDWTASTGSAQVVKVTKDGSGLCNSVAFSQVPGHRDLFLGRLKQNTSPDKCSGDNWSMGLF